MAVSYLSAPANLVTYLSALATDGSKKAKAQDKISDFFNPLIIVDTPLNNV